MFSLGCQLDSFALQYSIYSLSLALLFVLRSLRNFDMFCSFPALK